MLLQLKERNFLLRLLVIWMLLIFPRLTLATDSTPMEVIQSNTDKVLTILHQSKSGQTQSLRQREGEILDVVSNYFNFDEMSKRSLGDAWKQQPPEKIQEFSRLFKKLLFNTYVGRMENYHDEKTFYDSQRIDDDFSSVKTHFLHQSDNISIDYKLHRERGQWKVYDVVVEGISYDDNYRSQIASILAHQSFDSLISMLRQKVERHD
jgi:phospholipid transport system substrate-binding protein